MVRWITIVLAIIVLGILLRGKKLTKDESVQIQLSELSHYFEKLQLSHLEDAFLIVNVINSDLFIQFTADSSGFQMDFPLILESHKNLENRFLSIGSELGVSVERVKSIDDKDEFLDINLDGSASMVSEKVISFIEKLFNLNKNEIVVIDSHGI